MDIEGEARQYPFKDKLLSHLITITGDEVRARAIVEETKNSENINDEFVRYLCEYYKANVTAHSSGLGCRGMGDMYIHQKIAEVVGDVSATISPTDMDDAGVVPLNPHSLNSISDFLSQLPPAQLSNYIVVSVDGMHSRLSHFPFLAGFHVARASLRDVIMMGAKPIALFSDIHLANDGDVGKIFDYTSGIACVGEAIDVPLIAGSTLRIGGDMVLGDRLTGCAGAIGIASHLTPRKNISAGDVLILTHGSGGGTIATAAIYNGWGSVVKETINIDTIKLGIKLLASPHISLIHGMLDVTNGGIRGDMHELSIKNNLRIEINSERVRECINKRVLHMLDSLEIDYMGISIDSILMAVEERNVEKIMSFINENGITVRVVGRCEKGSGVYLKNGSPLLPRYREAPYTPIKKVVNITPKREELMKMKKEIAMACEASIKKKMFVMDMLRKKSL